MTNGKLISKLLNLKGMKVVAFWFKPRTKEMWLAVKPHKNGCRCSHHGCQRRGNIKRIMPDSREWRDVVVCGWKVVLTYRPKEVNCPTHGCSQELVPWAEQYSRITHRLEYLILLYAQLMTQKAAADLLCLASSTLSDLLHRIIGRLRDGRRIRNLKAIGIDEVSFKKGHKYVTVVYDLERSCVVWVGEGKRRETIDRFFNEELSDYQKKKIQWACCDMSETFIGAILDHCPNAKLVLDRFHVVKALGEAMDEVRKEEWRKVTGADKKALKGLRWLLFKHASTRTPEEKRILNALRTGNRRIHRACVLKDEFDQFWNFKAPWAAERFLNRWCTAALRSRLEPMRRFVKTIRTHSSNIITFISCRLTNAKSEGLNRVIRMVKNRASGYRSVSAFIDLIYLVVGDVDIPAQIPARFRTI